MPLSGIRVVDLTRILAGPFATMHLGDLGADVIKIEHPDGGDDTRGWGPPWVPGSGGASAYFTSVNRNKRCCTLDFKTEPGREILWRLIEGADVLISNFRPGVLDRLGFGWETVHARSPRVIDVLINGYGAEGPAAGKPAFDVIVQGESGVMDLTGHPDGPPTRVGISLGDETAGLLAVQGILAALLVRERTGQGQRVEIALHDGLLSLLTFHAQTWWAGGKAPTRIGNAHPSIVPYQTFATADGWMNVGVGNEGQWRRFCEAVERNEWIDDPRFRTNADRLVHREELVPMIEQILRGRSTAEWIEAFAAVDVPCGRIRPVPEALDSPEARARGMIVEIEGGDGNPLPLLGPAVKLSASPAGIRRRPPRLGEHTDEVLGELGYAQAEVLRLRENGVI
ncbi:MAG TPA: CaiB/BaiF CoA-transferase family protein [Gemmatimonadota bacterium]|nr:CaiB/BaiF CoA-transferase family protein [Gemmatimonadota bacterium]